MLGWKLLDFTVCYVIVRSGFLIAAHYTKDTAVGPAIAVFA